MYMYDSMYIHIHTIMFVYIYMCIYIYMYISREREREISLSLYIYIYIYTYTHTHTHVKLHAPVDACAPSSSGRNSSCETSLYQVRTAPAVGSSQDFTSSAQDEISSAPFDARRLK